MNKIVNNIIALSISSALSISFVNNVNAATYQLEDIGEASKLRYTFAQHQNINGDMAISGAKVYNFPVQFEYLDDDDFDQIVLFASQRHLTVHALSDIENAESLRAGNPTANDLAWIVLWLQNATASNIEYQKVGDSIAMTNIGGVTADYNLWDVPFQGTNVLTRSTVDFIGGITNEGTSYGSATAPYLPVTHNNHDVEKTYWMREFGQRGFFSFNQGADIFPLMPLITDFSGGISAINDVNESGVAVGISSYKVSETYIDYVENGAVQISDDTEVDRIRNVLGIRDFVQFDLNNPEDGIDDDFDENYVIRGCNDPYILRHIPYSVCVSYVEQSFNSSPYQLMAVKSVLSTNGEAVTEPLGLLVTPHPDDERAYSSYALAVNNSGVAVGYADGFLDETVTEPAENERVFYQYAVVYKNGEVIDLSGDHTNKGNSLAYDINNNGIAVGHITKLIGGNPVQKFFHVDTNVPVEEINMVTPDDFFTGSNSTVRAINNNGLMVGEGEVETHKASTQNPRRTAAFVYDMNENIFTNLNEAIPCDFRQTHDILQARGINDDGMISATALVKVDRRDAKGEVMLDDTGTPLKEDVLRAINLKPMSDDGVACPVADEDKVTRKGASVSFSGIISIMALFGLRRKFFN